jgi:MSHA pilin protein MshA
VKRQGFTLIELIMVIVIIGILAAVAIPKFIDLQNDAKQAGCDGNLGVIRAAITAYYAKTAVGGSAAFPTSLTLATFADNYFADATLPQCPFGSTYVYDSSLGTVNSHAH